MLSKISRVRIRRFHRWIGVILGIQLIFWISSGAYFAWMPIKIIKDEDRKAELSYAPLPLAKAVPIDRLPLPEDFILKVLHLENTPRGASYRLESTDARVIMFDAITGQKLEHLAPDSVAELALKQMAAADAPVSVHLLQETPDEYKGPRPVYQISIDDFRQTHLYADPWTGRVITRRNRFWRAYDFLWMLHILDFKEREDFNNPFLRTLSVGALILLLSGYLLFFFGKPARAKS